MCYWKKIYKDPNYMIFIQTFLNFIPIEISKREFSWLINYFKKINLIKQRHNKNNKSNFYMARC